MDEARGRFPTVQTRRSRWEWFLVEHALLRSLPAALGPGYPRLAAHRRFALVKNGFAQPGYPFMDVPSSERFFAFIPSYATQQFCSNHSEKAYLHRGRAYRCTFYSYIHSCPSEECRTHKRIVDDHGEADHENYFYRCRWQASTRFHFAELWEHIGSLKQPAWEDGSTLLQ